MQEFSKIEFEWDACEAGLRLYEGPRPICTRFPSFPAAALICHDAAGIEKMHCHHHPRFWGTQIGSKLYIMMWSPEKN